MYRLNEYKNAIENTNIVSKTDINGIITFVNEEFCNLCGFSEDELLGQNHNIIRHPDTPKSAFKKLWDTILAGRVHKGVVKNKKKNGDFFYAQTTIIPIFDEDGTIFEFIAIRHDVTKLFTLNEELVATKQKLMQLNENLEQVVAQKTNSLKILNENLEKKIEDAIAINNAQQKIIFQQNRQVILGQMLENIAHQWRQPLNELSLAIYLLHNEKKDKHYKLCQKLIQNMSQTINDFRDFINPNTPLEKHNLIKVIKHSLYISYQALKKNNIKTTFDIDVKKCCLFCNFNELVQVLVNIINNAKDAFLEQELDDKILHFKVFKEKKNLILQISDNAGAIPSNIIEHIFDPYFTTKHKKQGVGLGLYICKQILNKINADIRCFNKGNCAYFELIFKGEEC
ncbi:PAS domain-containing sensor histidine kinase [Campylobacter sp. 2018MI01]|uniref:sensor histidine kinase n=1 Tax=Campylobacter sp. 2018MI01 TaxID=2836735 RepID=UPI001BDA535F|nr:PAS domain-containing sensor histidine kinase [Campylobacter sp. 2018MI01]MBT0877923.1 PAS domain-containing sensor histidine kinase [Campylobacter sp. 2018MI01]